jgi:Domain of unknown function (DUF4384)
MSTATADRIWTACLSALQLDRYAMGELTPAAAKETASHLAGCRRCGEAMDVLRAARAEPLPPLRMVPLAARRRASRLVAAGIGVAAAACVLLMIRPGGDRLKGPGVALGMYVDHGGEVRRAGPGETVAPGDALRFTVTAPQAVYVAVLSVDPAGRASVYYPRTGRAEPVQPGVEVALPLGTRLDDTLGEERIVGVFCSSPVELEPLRAGLERGGFSFPDSCQVTRWSFVKR